MLILVAGAWASGKSAIVALLARELPAWAVFDWDWLIPRSNARSVTTSGKTPRPGP
jgi:uridine kinase